MSKKSFRNNKENKKGGAPVPPPFPGKESVQSAAAPELPAFNKEEEIRKAAEAAHSVPKHAVQNEDEELTLFTGSLKKVEDEPEVFRTAANAAMNASEEEAEQSEPEEAKKPEPAETTAEEVKTSETKTETAASATEETPAAETKPGTVSVNEAKETTSGETADSKTKDGKAEETSENKKSVSPAIYPIKIPPVPTSEKASDSDAKNVLSPASIKPARVRRITKQKNTAPVPEAAKKPKYKAGKIPVGLFMFALICGFAGGFGGFMWFE